MRFAAACAAIFSLAATAAEATPKTRCDFYKTTMCDVQECYDGTQPKAWAIIDWDQSDYSLCDPSSCKHLTFIRFPDGVYVSFTFPASDIMFKLNLTDSSAVETSTLTNTAVISFGNCKKDPANGPVP